MKKDPIDYVGKKNGWGWYALLDVIKFAIKNPQLIKEIFTKKKK